MQEKTINSRTIFDGRILRLEVLDVELENGQKAYREIVRHKGAVAVLARHRDGRFVLVRQFRKAVEQYMLEVVAGLLNPGEAGEACARRELIEETGFQAVRIAPLGVLYPSPGYVTERIEVFYAEVDGEAGAQNPDEGEHVQVVFLTAGEFEALVRAGGVLDSKTLAAFLLYEKKIAPSGGVGP